MADNVKKSASIIQTSKYSGERHTYKGSFEFVSENQKTFQWINVFEDVEYQTVEGFGGSFTEAAAVTLGKMSPEKQEQILQAYFNPDKGLGYTICRTHINSCDFSLGNYAYVEDGNDVELKTFSIERDRKALIPMIKEAQKISREEIRIISSPWSPPTWMKSNRMMNQGGRLLDEYKSIWAKYFAKYIKAYAEEGINIWGITVQNEPNSTQPWDSCLYSSEEERDFVKLFLGPTLYEENLKNIKILVWDHNKEYIVERARTILSDPEAAEYIYGIGFHWYTGDHFEALDAVNRMYPGKVLIHTEGCVEGGTKPDSWETGERYGHDIIGDFNHWTTAWVDWNLLLDEKGGPNHVGNFCDAPIIGDTANDKLIYESSYYYIGHFSKFVKPGAKRVGCSKFTVNLETVAFKNPDGQIVVIVMNRSEEKIPFTLKTGNGFIEAESFPRSIITMIY